MTTHDNKYFPCIMRGIGTDEIECRFGLEFYRIHKEFPYLEATEYDLKFHETYCKYCLMEQQAEAMSQIFSFMVAWYK